MKRGVAEQELPNTPRRSGPIRRVLGLLRFALFYSWEMLLSNFRIAHDIVTPRNRFRPGIVRVPLPELSDRQLLVLTNLITMTPGTLTLELGDDRRSVYLHCMYIDDPERLRRDILEGYVYRIRELF